MQRTRVSDGGRHRLSHGTETTQDMGQSGRERARIDWSFYRRPQNLQPLRLRYPRPSMAHWLYRFLGIVSVPSWPWPSLPALARQALVKRAGLLPPGERSITLSPQKGMDKTVREDSWELVKGDRLDSIVWNSLAATASTHSRDDNAIHFLHIVHLFVLFFNFFSASFFIIFSIISLASSSSSATAPKLLLLAHGHFGSIENGCMETGPRVLRLVEALAVPGIDLGSSSVDHMGDLAAIQWIIFGSLPPLPCLHTFLNKEHHDLPGHGFPIHSHP